MSTHNTNDRFELYIRTVNAPDWVKAVDDLTLTEALTKGEVRQAYDDSLEFQIRFRHPDGTLEDVYYEHSRSDKEREAPIR